MSDTDPTAPEAPEATPASAPSAKREAAIRELAAIGQQFIGAIPHTRALGMEFLGINAGIATMRVPYDERFAGDPETGVLHGGVVTALLDSCSGAAVLSHPSGVTGTATIDLRIDYMRPARPGRAVTCRATCYRVTRSVAFVRGEAWDEDEGDLIASSAGAFTVDRGAGFAKQGAEMARKDDLPAAPAAPDAPEAPPAPAAARDAVLGQMVDRISYARFLGIGFDRLGDELTARLAFSRHLIGNPFLPALHGGATGAFLELAAQTELAWAMIRERAEAGGAAAEAIAAGKFPPLPRTIDFTVDYLRTGLPRDAYARARIIRHGRRYASVAVEAWQEERDRPFAAATAHFAIGRDD